VSDTSCVLSFGSVCDFSLRLVERGDGTADAYAASVQSFPCLWMLSPLGGTLQTKQCCK
jgi:hypothetical protein